MRFLLSIDLKLPVVVCAEVGKVAEGGRMRRPDERSHYFVQYWLFVEKCFLMHQSPPYVFPFATVQEEDVSNNRRWTATCTNRDPESAQCPATGKPPKTAANTLPPYSYSTSAEAREHFAFLLSLGRYWWEALLGAWVPVVIRRGEGLGQTHNFHNFQPECSFQLRELQVWATISAAA